MNKLLFVLEGLRPDPALLDVFSLGMIVLLLGFLWILLSFSLLSVSSNSLDLFLKLVKSSDCLV